MSTLLINATERDSALRRATLGLFRTTLPARTKRLILFASLTANLRDDHRPERSVLERLNSTMSLASADLDALRLPALLHASIWRGAGRLEIPRTVFSAERTTVEIQSVVALLLSKLPAWLRYGDHAEIQSDVYRYFWHSNHYVGKSLTA